MGDLTYAGAVAASEDRAYLHAAAIRIWLPTMEKEKRRGRERRRGETVDDDGDGDGETETETETGRLIEIVCPPSEGVEWCTESFREAWRNIGFSDAEVAGTVEWFPGNKLLRSSSKDFL